MLHFSIRTCKISTVIVRLQIKYLLVTGLNLDEIMDEIGDFGWMTNEILDNVFLVSLLLTYSQW